MVRLEDYGTWDEALKRLEASRKALLALLREADPAWLSAPLREGAWTPLMVAEHVALVEDSTARVLRRLRRLAAGENLPPVPVKPGEFKDGKPQAPEGVRPKGGLSLEEVLALLDRARAFLLEEVAKAAKAEAADMAVADLLLYTLITMVQMDNWLIVFFSPGLVVKEDRAAKEEQGALGVLEAEYKLRVRMR